MEFLWEIMLKKFTLEIFKINNLLEIIFPKQKHKKSFQKLLFKDKKKINQKKSMIKMKLVKKKMNFKI